MESVASLDRFQAQIIWEMSATSRIVMLGICFVIASISAVSCAVLGQDEITLIGPDKPEPVIVIGVGATPSENYAAQEMAGYLGTITDRKITISDDSNLPKGRVIIALGRNKLTESIDVSSLDCEQFITDIQPDRLTIIGGRRDAKPGQGARDAGTLYGVYEFLDGLGVRWYRPEAWGVHVPKMATINLNIGRTISPKPSYNVRAQLGTGMGVFRGQTIDQRVETFIWLARNRGNVYCKTGDAARDALLDAKVGGGERYSWTHAYGTIVPKAEFFESNPDYFSLVKGKREPVDLCLGNPELQKVFTERLIATAQRDPLMSSISVDPDDARGGTCECELCKAMDLPLITSLYGDGSNRVVAFNNKVAEAAAKEAPWVKVGWLAYSSHTLAPTNIERLAPNTIITIAPINRLNDWRTGLMNESSSNANLVKTIRDWARLKPYTMQVYEYYAGYRWPGPTPFTRSVADRWRNYRKLGITGINNETVISWGPQGLDMFMSARLAWNPDMVLEKELNLYYKNYYGPAENPMRAYHERLMDALETAKYPVRSGGQGMYLIFTPALVNELRVYIRNAQRLVKDKPLYERRLRGVALGYEFARRVSDILVLKKKTGVLTEIPGRRGAYYKSEEARNAYGDLVRWVRRVNTGDSIFDISRRFKVDAAEVVFLDSGRGAGAAWLYHLPLDILTNDLHPHTSEEIILADF